MMVFVGFIIGFMACFGNSNWPDFVVSEQIMRQHFLDDARIRIMPFRQCVNRIKIMNFPKKDNRQKQRCCGNMAMNNIGAFTSNNSEKSPNCLWPQSCFAVQVDMAY